MIRKFPLFHSEWKEEYLCRWCIVSTIFYNGFSGKLGCLPFSKKMLLKMKWNIIFFLKNLFGNCRLPPEVVLLFSFGTERKKIALPVAFHSLISRQYLREIKLQMVSAISFVWLADFGKTLTIIHRSSQPVCSDKW